MTGRYIITMRKDAHAAVGEKLANVGIAAATPVGPRAVGAHPLPRGKHIMLPRLGLAVVDPLTEHEDALHQLAASEAAVLGIEPERIVRATSKGSPVAPGVDYVRGWRDAIEAISAKLLPGLPPGAAPPRAQPRLADVAGATWGLIATNVVNSRFSGAGINVAVLDTGFDLTHPDFAGRAITTADFVGDNSPFHDGVGHGTHVTGTACGPLQPTQGPRYGIVYNAAIFAGRVLDDNGFGGDANILQGIDWALSEGAAIISMSLASHWFPGDPPFSQAYEAAAQQALAAGCLMICAAGNDAANPSFVGAVAPPGNSPSVLTVAAVDSSLATAPFSNRVQPDAPGVKGPDIAGPGVDVYSSWLVADGQYNTISGTSMATPHVSGIAALWAESQPNARGQALKDLVLANAQALNDGNRQGEVGQGLVQAPVDQ
jgi:subtilisin family serine protease